jgi:hypothetical protein
VIGRLLGVAVPLGVLASMLLLGLGRAGRFLRAAWTDWLDEGARRHRLAYAVLHPHQIAVMIWLALRTRSSR